MWMSVLVLLFLLQCCICVKVSTATTVSTTVALNMRSDRKQLLVRSLSIFYDQWTVGWCWPQSLCFLYFIVAEKLTVVELVGTSLCYTSIHLCFNISTTAINHQAQMVLHTVAQGCICSWSECRVSHTCCAEASRLINNNLNISSLTHYIPLGFYDWEQYIFFLYCTSTSCQPDDG